MEENNWQVNRMNRLVLFGTKIGLNFSGGSNATILLFQHIVPHFHEVVIICKELGEVNFDKPFKHLTWQTHRQAIKLIKGQQSSNCIFYGDFQDGILLVRAQVPFYFTYHDNWPELGKLSFAYWLQSFKNKARYKVIFSRAQHVFSVTQQKIPYINNYTKKVSLVRNGHFMPQNTPNYQPHIPNGRLKLLMIGNLTNRKYKLALDLFSILSTNLKKNIQIDIYGHPENPNLVRQLTTFSFVTYQGFETQLSFRNYHLLLSTSFIENLPISMLKSLINYTPVLSFKVGGIHELVESGKDGILIAPYDVEQMAHELEQLYRYGYDFSFPRQKLEMFEWERSAKLMLEIFKQGLNE